MIFEIISSIAGDTIFRETKYSKPYQSWDCLELMRNCGFYNVFVCCAGGYENGLIFISDIY